MDALVPLLKRWPIYKLGLLPDSDKDTCLNVGTSFGAKYPHANCFHDTCNIILNEVGCCVDLFCIFFFFSINGQSLIPIIWKSVPDSLFPWLSTMCVVKIILPLTVWWNHLYLNYLFNPRSSLVSLAVSQPGIVRCEEKDSARFSMESKAIFNKFLFYKYTEKGSIWPNS